MDGALCCGMIPEEGQEENLLACSEYTDKALCVKWWGYLHSSGTLQLKRWFGDPKDYTTDCEGNEFVLHVVPPFDAPNPTVALEILRSSINQHYNNHYRKESKHE
jgi:hypothetical protein